MEVTHTIFKSPKVVFETGKNDYRLVRAIENIDIGEHILIEHCFVSNKYDHVLEAIKKSQNLFDNLYPRVPGATCDEKATKNLFYTGETFSIALDTSRFNHSTDPNAVLTFPTFINADEGVHLCIIFVYANKAIKAGEEITIWYGNKYFNEDAPEVGHNFEINKEFEKSVIDEHIINGAGKKLVLDHACLKIEYYLNSLY